MALIEGLVVHPSSLKTMPIDHAFVRSSSKVSTVWRGPSGSRMPSYMTDYARTDLLVV